jgi:hypothetical protein
VATQGQPGKAGKSRRDSPAAPARGRVVATRVRTVGIPVRDAESFGTRMMRSLGIAYGTSSPMDRGSGPQGGAVSLNIGAGIVGRDARRTGALQEWRGAGAPIAKDHRRAKVGIQGGPASMPAFPSTGMGRTYSLVNPLTGMDTPFALRNPGVA